MKNHSMTILAGCTTNVCKNVCVAKILKYIQMFLMTSRPIMHKLGSLPFNVCFAFTFRMCLLSNIDLCRPENYKIIIKG